MDVLYFMKEEYSFVKEALPGLAGGDVPMLEDTALEHFLLRLTLILRVEDELLLPELAERLRHGHSIIEVAMSQLRDLSALVGSGLQHRGFSDARRAEMLIFLVDHLEHMEKQVLPRFRMNVSTPTREDIGIVALDYRDDLNVSSQVVVKTQPSRSISA